MDVESTELAVGEGLHNVISQVTVTYLPIQGHLSDVAD